MNQPDSYCPLCGERNLPHVRYHKRQWVFCPVGATSPADAHTAYPLDGLHRDKVNAPVAGQEEIDGTSTRE